jgi:hypothetical protein
MMEAEKFSESLHFCFQLLLLLVLEDLIVLCKSILEDQVDEVTALRWIWFIGFKEESLWN